MSTTYGNGTSDDVMTIETNYLVYSTDPWMNVQSVFNIKGLAENLEKSLTSVPLIEVSRELCQCYMYFVLGMQAWVL